MTTQPAPLWAQVAEAVFSIIGCVLAAGILASMIVATGAIVIFI